MEPNSSCNLCSESKNVFKCHKCSYLVCVSCALQITNEKCPQCRDQLCLSDGVRKFSLKLDEVYEGEWLDGKKHGHGKLSCSDGTVFDGEWQRDGFVKGKFVSAGGNVYEGSILPNGDFHGHGYIKMPDVYEYTGEFAYGQKHGRGCYRTVDSEYTGQFAFGQVHGFGQGRKSNGITYVGEWRHGQMHGRGTRTSDTGEVDEGEWRNEIKYVPWYKRLFNQKVG